MHKTLLVSAAIFGLAAGPALAQSEQSQKMQSGPTPGSAGQATSGMANNGAGTTNSSSSGSGSTIKPPGHSVVPPTGGSGQQ